MKEFKNLMQEIIDVCNEQASEFAKEEESLVQQYKDLQKAVHKHQDSRNEFANSWKEFVTALSDGLHNSISKMENSNKAFAKIQEEFEPTYCEYCGKAISKVDDYLDNYDGDFCNQECYDAWLEEEENEEDDYYVGDCVNCGNPIYEDDDYISNENGLFCDEDCYDEYCEELREEDETLS